MDLILLQPGDATIIPAGSTWSNASNSQLSNWGTAPGQPTGPCFELTSIHQGMKQQITTDVSNNARTSGRPIITEFTCVKYVDPASTFLYDRCLRALPIGSNAAATTIYMMRNSGETLATIMSIQLCNAIVSEIQMQSHPDDMPTEQFKLNFTDIVWQFYPQANDTTIAGALVKGWSVRKNMAIAQFPTS